MMSPSDPGGLLLVPDVGEGRGLGHLQRCLALGEAWLAAGGEAAALVPGDRTDAVARCVEAKVAVAHAAPGVAVSTARLEQAAEGRAWCVLDGYDFGASHLRAAAKADNVALIDDHGRTGAHGVDVVIDHNPGATEEAYEGSGARVLAGERYTLLRDDHRPDRRSADSTDEPDRLVVVMGGSPEPATIEFVTAVLDALHVPEDRLDLVGLDAQQQTGRRAARVISRGEPLAPVFRRARLAFSAAGSTTWELAVARTPMVLISIAANQVPVGETAEAMGLARYLGDRDRTRPADVAAALDEMWADPAAAQRAAAPGQARMDGLGATRTVAALRSVTVSLRPAVMDDAHQLWAWANEPSVREMAFDGTAIPWDDHLRWLRQRLEDDGTRIYLAGNGGNGPWGQVRFDRVGDGEVETDVSIDPTHRGQGLGAPLLVAATTRLRGDCADVSCVRAQVKDVNQASARAFVGAGFAPVASAEGVDTFEWTP